jgi:hypothetical protein
MFSRNRDGSRSYHPEQDPYYSYSLSDSDSESEDEKPINLCEVLARGLYSRVEDMIFVLSGIERQDDYPYYKSDITSLSYSITEIKDRFSSHGQNFFILPENWQIFLLALYIRKRNTTSSQTPTLTCFDLEGISQQIASRICEYISLIGDTPHIYVKHDSGTMLIPSYWRIINSTHFKEVVCHEETGEEFLRTSYEFPSGLIQNLIESISE